MITKSITFTVVFNANGTPNREESLNDAAKQLDQFMVAHSETAEKIGGEVTSFLLDNPTINRLALGQLVASIWDRRVEEGAYKGKTVDERNAARDQLAESLKAYVESDTDRFYVHQGKGRGGIAFRHVPGDYVMGENGKPKLENGEPVQRYRWTDEDWSKLGAKKGATDAADDAAPASTPAPAAATKSTNKAA